MATYKVIQDIEAEDKLVGPLTLRQFIYAAIGAIAGYICFLGITKGAAIIMVVFLPIMLACGFFAFPWKGDQPTEIWALARLRFAIKPRRRIWDQTGVKDYVTITVPKKVEIHYTNGLNQDEVATRLHTLADVIDSRGWATRNAPYTRVQDNSDRLVGAGTLPQTAMPEGVAASDDMLDEQSTVAQNIDSQLDKSTSDHRKRILQQMSDAGKPGASVATPQVTGPILPSPVMPTQPAAAAPVDTAWFMNDPSASGQKAQIVTPGGRPASTIGPEPTEEEKALAEQFKEQNQVAQQISYGHLHVVQPLSADGKPPQGTPSPAKPIIDYKDSKELDTETAQQKALAEQARKRAEAAVTHQPDPAIIELANNDDEDIATLARRANKEIRKTPDEVEIRLH
jgi:hypothetical protein